MIWYQFVAFFCSGYTLPYKTILVKRNLQLLWIHINLVKTVYKTHQFCTYFFRLLTDQKGEINKKPKCLKVSSKKPPVREKSSPKVDEMNSPPLFETFREKRIPGHCFRFFFLCLVSVLAFKRDPNLRWLQLNPTTPGSVIEGATWERPKARGWAWKIWLDLFSVRLSDHFSSPGKEVKILFRILISGTKDTSSRYPFTIMSWRYFLPGICRFNFLHIKQNIHCSIMYQLGGQCYLDE